MKLLKIFSLRSCFVHRWLSIITVLIIEFEVAQSVEPTRKTCNVLDSQLKDRVEKLQQQLIGQQINAYIVPGTSEHEGLLDEDSRLHYLTGLDTAEAVALVYSNKTLLFTQFAQIAATKLDCYWILIQSSDPYLAVAQHLKNSHGTRLLIAGDARLVQHKKWIAMGKILDKSKHILTPQTANLVDAVRKPSEIPSESGRKLVVHEMRYSGRSWRDKVQELRTAIKRSDATHFATTASEEISWLLNLKGQDFPFHLAFKAYLIVHQTNLTLFVSGDKITSSVKFHLGIGSEADGSTTIALKDYYEFYRSVHSVARNRHTKVLISENANFALYSMIPEQQRLVKPSPVADMMKILNPTELNGIRIANAKDATSWFHFLARISGNWTEISAMEAIRDHRLSQPSFRNESSPTTIAFNKNSADRFYAANNETNTELTGEGMLILDAGGNYLEGTTYCARTFSLGSPQSFHKEVYTRILMGILDIISLKFPAGTKLSSLDKITSGRYLFEVGLQYNYSTWLVLPFFNPSDYKLSFSDQERLCRSDSLHPGMQLLHTLEFYTDTYGIRITNPFLVTETSANRSTGIKYVSLESACLIPYDRSLIEPSMLYPHHRKQFNKHNKELRTTLRRELKKLEKEYQWLLSITKAVDETTTATSPRLRSDKVLHVSLFVIYLCMYLFSI